MSVKRVGVIGGGQLAWMMAGAARKLGIELLVQTPRENDPAAKIASQVILAPVDDAQATEKLATLCDVITFENEFINLEALQKLEHRGVCFHPSLTALDPLLDKYHQRNFLQNLGLPVPRFQAVESTTSNSPWDFPVVVKARRHGYDGRGTFIVHNREELIATCQDRETSNLMLEEFVPFERELAVMAARGIDGEVVIYPIVETQQEKQVCRRVIAPAGIDVKIEDQIRSIANSILSKLEVVGIFGIELFLTPEGKIFVNEIAPRTHNSGHYTLDACKISQFEMHLRAVAGLPLKETEMAPGSAVMINLLGYEDSRQDYLEKRQKIAAIPQAHLHWYGKLESRPGRKLGHVTVLLDAKTRAQEQMSCTIEQVESIWYQ